ncbi:hypothetical protein C8F04DRAFT_262251 [Mycena alexandri]|uniref:Uncharacterized protein n=1 Tax=Mycena alexandri TaxID=1745969 RepID=A0AAD6WS60_9AGAR|nr:hypothetical protein C8F04DRAFT_262251 [Mycena alexandri]
MYRHSARRLLLKNGLVQKQGLVSSTQLRFKATAPPRPPKADIQSIPQALRELLPEPRKRDPNAPPKRGRSIFFYIACISPLFIWLEAEKYFDPQPLIEKRRQRALRERLGRLRDENRAKPNQFADQKSVVAYTRLLLNTMLPEDILRNLHFEEIFDLLAEECPEQLLSWFREICILTYDLSLRTETEKVELKTAEHIQDTAEIVLRRSWLAAHRRLATLLDIVES